MRAGRPDEARGQRARSTAADPRCGRRERKIRQAAGECVVVGRMSELDVAHRREEVAPHGIEHRLHHLDAREQRDHRVLLGEHEHVLPERAVTSVSVA